jgi:tRNA (guanine-N7-)-methyltransferase
MRLRNIPGADEVIATSPFCIQEPAAHKGMWQDIFSDNHPIHMEIGMGKGQFLMGMAAAHSDINYIGMEKYSSVLLRAVQKMEENPLDNLRFLCFNAEDITEIFAPGEVERIYLNFSDPWPKDRHAKRRLTSSAYLQRYDSILAKDGRIEFKTDNVDLFDFSVEEIEASSTWHIDTMTKDLHHDATLNQGNIMTEYEERFSAKGNPICKLICSRG